MNLSAGRKNPEARRDGHVCHSACHHVLCNASPSNSEDNTFLICEIGPIHSYLPLHQRITTNLPRPMEELGILNCCFKIYSYAV